MDKLADVPMLITCSIGPFFPLQQLDSSYEIAYMMLLLRNDENI